MPPKITLQPKGFSGFSGIQGNPAPPANRGVTQGIDGRWFGWQRQPKYTTDLYDTRVQAKEALFRDAPKERQ